MKKTVIISAIFSFFIIFMIKNTAISSDNILTMSTTTSTQASGLLDILLPEFEKDTKIKVKVIAKGTGAAISDGQDGNVDIIFVHAKSKEEKFIKDGFGTKRYSVMHNDFIIIGPKKDPAGIRKCKNAKSAFKKIAESAAIFISRGDNSGTHTMEQALWIQSKTKLDTKTTEFVKKGEKKTLTYSYPHGKWYISLGQGMGKTITYANEKQTYTLSDRGTYIKYKFGKKNGIDLEVLYEKDPALNNPYGIIPVNPKKYPHVKFNLAKQFVKWITSPKGQSLIKNYKLSGRQLFYPDAIK